MKIKGCDFLEFLRKIPDDTADLVFTDPPYWTLDEHRKVGTTTRLKSSGLRQSVPMKYTSQ